jgi:hypothetical protein
VQWEIRRNHFLNGDASPVKVAHTTCGDEETGEPYPAESTLFGVGNTIDWELIEFDWEPIPPTWSFVN